MPRSIIHLARMCLLTAGMLMAVQVSARPTQTAVIGTSNVQNDPVGGAIVQDPAGNSHIRSRTCRLRTMFRDLSRSVCLL